MAGNTRFDTSKVLAHFAEKRRQLTTAMALVVEGQAKINVRENGQIDTGFMVNTVYTVGASQNNYAQTWADGEYKSTKRPGEWVDEKKAPEMAPSSDDSAIVAVGAEYAIYQEAAKSFLYKALQQSKGAFGATVKKVAQDD